MALQSIQPCFPEGANPFHPGYGLAKRLAVQAADVVAAVYVALDEAGPLEHHQVFRNGVERDRKLVGDIGDPCRSRPQLFENGSAGGIGNRPKNGIERGFMINHRGDHSKERAASIGISIPAYSTR